MTQSSERLDPSFCGLIQTEAKEYDAQQSRADKSKWEIATITNIWWSEHQGIFEGNKKEYYAEVSRVANIGLDKPRFSASGETLRRYCELQESYKNVTGAENLLKQTSFDHLMTARKLAKDGKVGSPIEALTEAYRNRWTEDEMKFHYDPPQIVHPYDKINSWLDGMQDKDNWQWLNSAEKTKEILAHVAEIKNIMERK